MPTRFRVRHTRMTGKDRRLEFEYSVLTERFGGRDDISVEVTSRNAAGMPTAYMVEYRIRSICSVEHVESLGLPGSVNPPLFADRFRMSVEIPRDYPCIDAQPVYRFLTEDADGSPVPHPWHPNIRWFGGYAGRVCVNMPDTYTEIAWCVDRIARYLRYEVYHAINEPPYPEDQQVAAWVIRQGEPRGWVYFNEQ